MSGQRGYRRRRIWVNAHFQLKHTALTVGVAVAIMGVLGALWVRTLAEERKLMGLRQAGAAQVHGTDDPSAAEFDAEFKERVESGDLKRMLGLLGVAGVLVLVLAYVGVRTTFRAAGPAYAISQMLKLIIAGDLVSIRHLRKGDEFKFLEDDVFALRDALRAESAAEAGFLKAAADRLRAAGDPGAVELAGTLDGIVSVKEQRAGRKKGA